MENLIELHIKDFRAIASADVILNGITVVSGINGSGKSTMSKLLYDTFKYANDFEEIVLQETNKELRPFLSILEQMVSYSPRGSHEEINDMIRRFFYQRYFISSFADIPLFLASVKQVCKLFLDSIRSREEDQSNFFSPRMRKILGLNESENVQDIETSIENIKKQVQDINKKKKKKYEDRPVSLLKNRIFSDFNQMPNCSISE